jgi:hypothetical protein
MHITFSCERFTSPCMPRQAKWNCQHLANANKFGYIRRVNTMLGLFVPALVTPLELLGGAHEPAAE